MVAVEIWCLNLITLAGLAVYLEKDGVAVKQISLFLHPNVFVASPVVTAVADAA